MNVADLTLETHLHFALDSIALSIAVYVGMMALGLWRTLPHKPETVFLLLYGWLTAVFQIIHVLVPQLFPEKDTALFFPLTWFVADVVTLPLLFAFVLRPSRMHLTLLASVFIGGLVYVLASLSGEPSHRAGLLGRTRELLIAAPAFVGTIWIVCRREKLTPDNAAGVYAVAILGTQALASSVMALSHHPSDPASSLAHLLQITSLIPCCALLRKVLR